MGKEHTTVSRCCFITLSSVSIPTSSGRGGSTLICFAVYRGNKKKSLARSDVVHLGDDAEGPVPINFRCVIRYDHDFCYRMATEDREIVVALQAVTSSGEKRKTLSTFTFDVTETIHTPICRIMFAAQSAPLATVDCSISNVLDQRRLDDDAREPFWETAEIVEGQVMLPTTRRGTTIDTYKDLLLQKKGELLEKISQKKQEKTLRVRAEGASAVSHTDPATLSPRAAQQQQHQQQQQQRTLTSFELPPALRLRPGADDSGGGSGTSPLTPTNPPGASASPKVEAPGPLVEAAQTFVTKVRDCTRAQLENVVIWNPTEAQHGSRVTMPAPSQLRLIGFMGSVVVVGRSVFIPSLLRTLLDEVESRSADETTPPLTVKLAVVGRDALLVAVLRFLVHEASSSTRPPRVVLIPVRMSVDSSPSPPRDTELLDFLAQRCVTEPSRADFTSPPPTPKEHIALLSSWMQLPRLTTFAFPMGFVHGAFHPTASATTATSDDSSAATTADSVETIPFAKSVVITCATGIDVVFYEADSTTGPSPAAGGSSSGLRRIEMKRDPCCIGILRVPTAALPFAVGSTFRGAFVGASGVAVPPEGSLPLRVWTTRSLEKGLTLDPKTHAPAVLQSSLYGREVVKIVCSPSGAERILTVDIDGDLVGLRACNVTIFDSNTAAVPVAVL